MGRKKKQDVIVYSALAGTGGGSQRVLRFALHPVLDNRGPRGPKFPCRVAIDVCTWSRESTDLISSCRCEGGGSRDSRNGHVEFAHEAAAIAWLLDGECP